MSLIVLFSLALGGVVGVVFAIVVSYLAFRALGRGVRKQVAREIRDERAYEEYLRAQPFPTIAPTAGGHPSPVAVLGSPYRSEVGVFGAGARPYSWDVPWGTLPPGLVVRALPRGDNGGYDDYAEIAGVPTLPGMYAFTLEVRDSASPPHASRRDFRLTVFESDFHLKNRMLPPQMYDPARFGNASGERSPLGRG